MRHARKICWMQWMLLAMAVVIAMPFPAMAQAPSRQAGTVSARIAPANLLRGKQQPHAIDKDDKVLWGDLIKTEIGGRVRVRLDDGSILNIGSQSQLRIESHDAQTQRTQLQLAYGRMRASVVRITQPGEGFTVRSTAAVAGVVGTDLYNESTEFYTSIIALGGGMVKVTSPNAQYASFQSLLSPGEAMTLIADQRPGEKRLATNEELGNAFNETDVDEVVNLVPRATFPGASLNTHIQGKGVGGATAISFARAGITAQITGPATADGLPVNILVAKDVPFGTYPFTLQRPEGPQVGVLIVTSEENAKKVGGFGGEVKPPPTKNIFATRGAKFVMDASATETPAGTSIAAYLWSILNTHFSSRLEKFTINTSLLTPGDYVIQLVVINDRGQAASQRFNLTVEPGIQPAEIIRQMAAGYESLQPNQFLKYFDDQKFRNYAGFAAAIDDSFRNQLETVRVFQRPVNCSITEEQDQANCQADFELQFTKKDQPTEFLDASGNPFPPGVPAPIGSTIGKRLLTGTERTTLRFERGDDGWRIVDYAAQVSCPGGSQATGLNVGSCILALGSFSTPGFQILNGTLNGVSFTGLTLASGSLFIGGTLSGTFDVSALGGFNGAIDFTGAGTVLGAPVSATFTPNPASAGTTVIFTILAPSVLPAGFTGSAPFTFTITGTDSSGTITQSLSLNLVLTGSFTLTATPATTSSAPLTVAQGGTASFTVGVLPGQGFTSSNIVTLSIPSLPAGFTIPSPTFSVVAGGSTVIPITVTGSAALGPHTITVQGALGGLIQTVDIFVDVSPLPPFGLVQFTSPNAPLTLLANSSVVIGITATQNFTGFNTPVVITFGPLPAGVTVSPTTASVLPGSTQPFTFTFTPANNAFANFGIANITVTGTAAGIPVQTSTIVLNLGTAGSLPFSLVSSPSQSGVTLSSTSLLTTNFNVFVSSQQTFNQPINISVGTPPPGVTISPNTFVFTPGLSGSNVSYTVTVDPAVAVPGTYPVLISGVSGGISATTTWTLVINGAFSLSVSPITTQLTPLVVTPGGAVVNVNVTVTSINNFAGSVTVSFTSPFGGTLFQTVSVPAGGTALATFGTSATAGVGNTPVLTAFISASSPTGSALNSLNLPFMTIGPAGFSLSPPSSSTTVDINSGSTSLVITTVQPLGAFAASVDFTVVTGTVPAGVTVSPATQRIAAGGQARFTLRAATPAVVGNFNITVNAVSGATTIPYTIVATLRGQITLSVTRTPGGGVPGTQTVPLVLPPGGSLSFTVSVGGIDGFSGSVTAQASNMPSGVTAIFPLTGTSTINMNAPSSDTLTLTNVSAAPIPLTSVFVQAFDPSFSFTYGVGSFPSQQIWVTTGSPSFVLGCNPFGQQNSIPCNQFSFMRLNLNINQSGNSAQLSLQVDSIGGYNGSVSVTPVNMPAGVSMSPNPVTLSPGRATTVTFSAATPAVAGSFAFSLVGNDTVTPTLSSSTPVDGQLNGSIKIVVTPSTTQNNPAILQPGLQQVFSVDISGRNGFSGTADLNFFPSLPSGVTSTPPCCTISVNVPAVGSVTATVTFSAAANAPSSFTQSFSWNADGFDVQGNNDTYFVNGETSATSFFVVGPSSFNASVSGATLTSPNFVQVCQQTSISVTINAIGAFSGTVFLDVTGLPSTISVSSAPGSMATIPVRQGAGSVFIQPQIAGVNVPGASTTLFFTVACNAPRGFIQGTLTATSGALVQSIPLAFFVTPQITLNLTPTASLNAPMVIAPGGSANLQIAPVANPSFAGDVDLTYSVPSGFTISPVSARATIGGFTTVSISVAPTAIVGSVMQFSIIASINGNTVTSTTATIIVGSGAFSLGIIPGSATSSASPLIINAGSSGTVGVAITAIGAFSGSVTISASFSVASLSANPSSISIVHPGGNGVTATTSFTVNAAAGAQGLIGRMFINASGGGQSASAIVFISIGSGGFSLSVSNNTSTNPLSINIPSSSTSTSNQFSVLVHQQAGFTGTVSLVATGLPAGVTVTNNNFLVPAGTAQTFALDVAPTAAAGDTQFTITGTSGTVPNLLTVNLTVFLRVRGQYSLSIVGGATSTNPLVVAPGGSQNVSVDIVPVGSFFGTVQLSLSTFGLPSGVTVAPSSATASPGSPAQFTVSVAAGTPASTVSTFFISSSATFGSNSPNASVFVTVATNPTFNMSFGSPLSLSIGNQFGNVMSVSLSPVGGFSGSVTLTVNTAQLPAGVTVTPPSTTFPISGFGTSMNLNFIASSAVVSAGSFNVDITATSGAISITQTLQLDLLASFNFTLGGAGTSSAAPIVLQPTGTQNFNIFLFTSPPNIQCNGQPFSVALSIISTPPTGVSASTTPTATVSTPGVATITTTAAPATGVFSITGFASAPAACSQSGVSRTAFFTVGPAGFTLSTPSFQTQVNINQNSLSNVSVTVNSIGNFAGTVTVSVVAASVPAGVTVTPVSAAVTAGNSINFQVRADSPAVAGSASFNITATDGTTTLNGTIPLLLRGSYTLTISPANSQSQPAVVSPGQSINYTVTVNPQNGFSGTVNFFTFCCSSPPPGVSVTNNFSATTSSPGTITVTASASAVASQPQGVFFGSSSTGSFSGPSFSFFSAVGPAAFRVINTSNPGNTPSSPKQMVINGSTQTIDVSVQSLGGFSGTVDLALGSLLPGLTASPQTVQVIVPAGGSASFIFSFSAGSQLPQGPVDVQLTASQGTVSVNAFIYLYAVSNMALVQTPQSSTSSPLRLLNGDPVGQTVNVQVLNQGGFTGSVTLSVSSIPAGMTVTPTSAVVAANGSANFQITAQNAGGLVPVVIDASFSGLFAQTIIWFNVGVGSYTMSSTPASTSAAPISLDPNGTTIVPISVSIIPQNGFLGTVNITPTGVPTGVTVAPTVGQVVITSSATGTATFNFSATVAQGLTPVAIAFNATANVSTPAGVVPVNNSDTSFLLVNPPTFALTQTAGTSASHISIEQGIPPGVSFQIGVTGTGTVSISFANLPSGVTISPPIANVAAGSSGTFTVDASSAAALNNYIISVVGTSAGQTISLNLFVDVVVPTNGFFLSTTPPTSQPAPLILTPDHTLITFIDVNVQAKGTFTGTVALTLTAVPAGVTATLTPNVADLTLSPSIVVQLQFQTTTGLVAFGPSIVSVNGASGALTASTPVWVALQTVSAIANPASATAGLRAPEVLQVLPPGGSAGSHMLVTLQGSGLSSITQVLSSSTKLSARLEPNGTDSVLRLDLFARPEAPEGAYTLMLVSPRGTVPVGIHIAAKDSIEALGRAEQRADRPANVTGRIMKRLPGGRLASADNGDDFATSLQPVITRFEPASLKPGDVVIGKLYGENLESVSGVRVFGMGITIEVLESHPTELKVRYNVAAAAASGSRMISLMPGQIAVDAMLNIQSDRVPVVASTVAPASAAAAQAPTGSAPDASATPAPAGRGAKQSSNPDVLSNATAGVPDLLVRSSDISMSPGNPKPGDNVTFRVLLSNRGGQDADNVDVEFSLGGANVLARERFSVPAGGTQSFQVEWQAAGAGRFEPRVVIDPQRRLSLPNRASATASMPAFELFSASGSAPRAATAMRERGQLTLTANGCQGFRFTSGTEQSCNGGADVEVRLAQQGGALRFEADGVRNLGAMAFDSVAADQASRGSMGTSETVLPGAVYLIETRRGPVLVRVMDIRGLNAVRGSAPAAMNRPRLGDVDAARASAPQTSITLTLEWRALAQ